MRLPLEKVLGVFSPCLENRDGSTTKKKVPWGSPAWLSRCWRRGSIQSPLAQRWRPRKRPGEARWRASALGREAAAWADMRPAWQQKASIRRHSSAAEERVSRNLENLRRGGRAKRFFRVTARGVAEVRAAQRMLTTMWSGIPELRGDVT